MTNYIIFEVIN